MSRRQQSRAFHTLMREARHKLAVSRRQWSREKSTVECGGRGSKRGTRRRQRSREKSAVERGAKGIKRGTLHCGDDVQRRQRSKEKSDVEGAGREIGLGVLLYASKTEMHVSSSVERGGVQKLIRKEKLDFKQYGTKYQHRLIIIIIIHE